jgi:HSP20 family protein
VSSSTGGPFNSAANENYGGVGMNLIRWNPVNEMMGLRHRFDRIFNEMMLPATGGRQNMALANWNPAVDIYDNEDRIIVKAEIPGVDKDHLSVDVHERVLTLKGERTDENEVNGDNYRRRERFYGKFQRSFSLPHAVDADSITANFKDGVLTVEIPKPEDRKPKQITVH